MNFQKSKIFTWNCSQREMLDITRVLEMEGTMSFESLKYLGIPIFNFVPRVAHWLPMLDKLKLCIQAWGATWLNLAGKVVLLKSVLTSLPLYQNSILLDPKTNTLKIDGLLRIFMWEGRRKNERKLHLVSWDKIKKPLLEGGLHIRDVATQNLTMGSKLLWNLISRKSSWSKQVL